MEVNGLLLLFLFSFTIHQSLQCGISTHISIAHQALQWFADQRGETNYRDLILDHQDAFIAGNPYPDAMYSDLCYKGKFHQVAEDTHWSPFLNATVNYIRSKYPKPWSKETEKLVVFMLGFVSHQVADITWHSLGIQQGFLQTMGKVNFWGSFPAAHSVGDPGGDMVASLEGDTEKISDSVDNWYVPSNDLAGIYNEYFGKEVITADEILTCTKILYLGWIGEKTGGAKLFKKYAITSPYLMEDLHSYFQGGVSDMAGWSTLLWHDTITMLEHGTNTCDIPKNPLFIQCNKTRGQPLPVNYSSLKNPGTTVPLDKLLQYSKLDDVQTLPTSQGSYLYPGKNLQRKISTKKTIKSKNQKGNGAFEDKPVTLGKSDVNSVSYSTAVPYANLGWSLSTGNFSGITSSVVVGTPNYGTPGRSQRGRVYVVDADKDGVLPAQDIDLDSKAHLILDGLEDNGRFGTALAVIDLNKDGIDDLAVSASSTGANSLQYTGTIYIYYGTIKKGLPSKPNLIINGKGQYYNLGTTLLGADVDNDGYKDLIIGSPYATEGGPQRGSVCIFLAKTPRKTEGKYTVSDADMKFVGEQDFSWFGYSVELVAHDKQNFLVVGAPTYRFCVHPNCATRTKSDIQSVGKVYVYPLDQGMSTPLVAVTGDETFMKLGTSLAFGRPSNGKDMLAVSAPTKSVQGHIAKVSSTFDQCGTVYLIDMADLLTHKGSVTLGSLNNLTLFEGDRSYARFGWKVGFVDLNLDGIDDLMLSSPFRTSDITEEVTGAEQGEAYVFYGGKDFPTGKATKGCSFLEPVEPCPAKKASVVFESSEDRSRLGSSFISIPNNQSTQVNLVISSPRSSLHGFHSGKLHVYKFAHSKQ